jgi:transposase-like protein
MTFADHLFKRHRFDRLVMVLCVRWYVTYKLSYRDLVEMMTERGLSMAHTTIMRWVLKLVPTIEQRSRKYARLVGRSWRVDETYIKVKGRWVYLYRAVDKTGQTVDFYLSEHRDTEAAKRFFRRAVLCCGPPKKVTLDGYQASHRAVDELKREGWIPPRTEVRSCVYLNNIVEQDHRRVKSRVGPMLGFKRFGNAAIVITGIELAQKLRKGQFNIHRLVKHTPGDVHDLWVAVLMA